MRARFVWAAAILGLVVGVAACGDDDKGGSTSSSGGASSGSTSGDPSSSGDAGDGGASTSSDASGTPAKTIAAPELKSIAKMAGSLHLTWELPTDTTCDTIEGERKSAAEPYEVVWTVPGTVDNKHDGTATEDTTYSYRLRCKAGTSYSEYSNEMSRNPQQ